MTIQRSAAALALTVMLVTAVFAADTKQKREVNKGEDGETRGVLVHKGTDNQPVSHVFRAADFIGMAVRNSDGKDLGTVDDFVVDFECGQVRYAAIGFGGFLGFGEKLFAVPLGVMGLNYDGEKQRSYLVFDTTAEELKDSPGFDRSKWPDMADPKWRAAVDKFYGVSFNDHAVGVAVKKEARQADKSQGHDGHHILRGSYLRSMTVRNDDGDELAAMKDVVIDLESGELTHLIASRGGVAGIGKEYVAIPRHAVMMKENITDNKLCIFLSVSKDRFQGAPHFSDKWPNFNDEAWSQQSDTYFKAQTTAARISKS